MGGWDVFKPAEGSREAQPSFLGSPHGMSEPVTTWSLGSQKNVLVMLTSQGSMANTRMLCCQEVKGAPEKISVAE